MKKLLKSEVCGSCEQCMGPIDVLKSKKFWLLFMHSALTVAFSAKFCLWNGWEKKEKKNKTQCKTQTLYKSYPNKHLVQELIFFYFTYNTSHWIIYLHYISLKYQFFLNFFNYLSFFIHNNHHPLSFFILGINKKMIKLNAKW